MKDFNTLMQRSYAYDAVTYSQYAEWKVLQQLYERNFVKAVEKDYSVLPKRIHQIWLGSPLPTKYKEWGDTWRRLNPGWEYRMWTDDDVQEVHMENPSLLGMLSNYGAKSDLLRYHILNQFGGIYIDTDFECLKPFDELTYLNFFTGAGYPSKPELYVGLIGCTVGHPIMQSIVKEVCKIDHDIRIPDVLNNVSSHFFTRNFFNVVNAKSEGVVAFPPQYFYPFPNEKGHQNRNGHDYIQPESLAVHHWEVSWTARNGNVDWVQGDKFKSAAQFTYAPNERHRDDYDGLPNTFEVFDLGDLNIVYTHTFYVKYLLSFLGCLDGKFVLITHNSDDEVNDTYDIPDNVIHWFAQNVNTTNPVVESIPIGLQNNRWDRGNNRLMTMVNVMKRAKRVNGLVYMNHVVKTNTAERSGVSALFGGCKWVTKEQRVDFKHYINQVYDHRFVLCPRGNGIDTHRMWETLYMRSIPIVKRDLNNRFYQDLPVCFVDEWDQVTQSFLQSEYDRIMKQDWNYEKLNFEWWRKRIKAYEKDSQNK